VTKPGRAPGFFFRLLPMRIARRRKAANISLQLPARHRRTVIDQKMIEYRQNSLQSSRARSPKNRTTYNPAGLTAPRACAKARKTGARQPID
jgi:hypothetical protein